MYNVINITVNVFSECSDGYHGARCHLPCAPGFFGTQCAGRCFPECDVEDCDRVSGCPVDNGNTIKMIGSYRENTTQAMKPGNTNSGKKI